MDDARRRYYRLTGLGRKVLDLECERMQKMVRMVQRRHKQEGYFDEPWADHLFGNLSTPGECVSA
jgi:hypothetical protein